MTAPPTIIYGPKASGKTRYSQELRAHYGCTEIVDDWPFNPALKSRLAPGALHLTWDEKAMHKAARNYGDVRLIRVEDALVAIGKTP